MKYTTKPPVHSARLALSGMAICVLLMLGSTPLIAQDGSVKKGEPNRW